MLRSGAPRLFFGGTAGDSGSLRSNGSRIGVTMGDRLSAVVRLFNAIEKHMKSGGPILLPQFEAFPPFSG